MHIRRPGYAEVAATVALALSVTGGAYAAIQLPKNSVGSKQVRNSSLLAKDFKAGQLPAGPSGPRGPQGVPGAKGDPGAPGPNLLQATRQDFAERWFGEGCPSTQFISAPITVPEPATLWASGTATYATIGAGVGLDHTAGVEVVLLPGSGDTHLARTAPSLEYRVDAAALRSDGWLGDGSGVFELQPGTSYRLSLTIGVTGSCVGSSGVTSPSISWATYPSA